MKGMQILKRGLSAGTLFGKSESDHSCQHINPSAQICIASSKIYFLNPVASFNMIQFSHNDSDDFCRSIVVNFGFYAIGISNSRIYSPTAAGEPVRQPNLFDCP